MQRRIRLNLTSWLKKNTTPKKHYHLDLPVDVPLFHVAEAPGLNGVSGAGVYADQSVVGDANQLVSLTALEPLKKNTTHLDVLNTQHGI